MEFDEKKYRRETLELDGKTLTYRAYEDLPYVKYPIKGCHRLSIYAPESLYQTGSVPYTLGTAPILFLNNVGGYMPGHIEGPGRDMWGNVNTAFYALLHGYVVVSAAIRGRQMQGEDGTYVGTAPAAICDMKAAVRFLRLHRDQVPGDVEKIITNGTSAGGALSALMGSTGNHPDYEEPLEELGAAREEDHIFAASCYCPIMNLEHADMAYEWEFCGIDKFRREDMELTPEGELIRHVREGELSAEQRQWSVQLKEWFPAYVNSLCLKNEEGCPLRLEQNGEGSLRAYIEAAVLASARKALERGEDLSNQTWLSIRNGRVEGMDFPAYVAYRTRMKATPAFDSAQMNTPENELFGTPVIQYRHFTRFGLEHSRQQGTLAEEGQIKRMNPMCYIRDEKARKAPYFRIRHGTVDRDTSLAIPAMLAAMLREAGADVDFAYAWEKPHAGDYDLEELFAWIDSICG